MGSSRRNAVSAAGKPRSADRPQLSICLPRKAATVWASLYSQHIYILKKKAGVWRIKTLKLEGMKKSNWEISSGKAVSPSPAGFMLRIYKRSPSHHGVPWWNFFHSQSSIHGKAGSAAFGMPASAGCIRNPDKYAKLIYKKVPIQSRVVVY